MTFTEPEIKAIVTGLKDINCPPDKLYLNIYDAIIFEELEQKFEIKADSLLSKLKELSDADKLQLRDKVIKFWSVGVMNFPQRLVEVGLLD